MKKLLLTAAAACAVAAPAFAEEAAGPSFSGNIALTSDYVFRGISQTNTEPTVQGGFDATYGMFYAGVWGSGLSGYLASNMEFDAYAGITPTLGPVALNFGVLGYFYPGANDSASELDYYELKAAANYAPIEPLNVGAAVYFSPDNYGETETAVYYELNAAYTVTPQLSFSGAYGIQTIDDIDGPAAGTDDSDYGTWNLGATYSLAGFSLDLRYIGTDIDTTDSIITSAYTSEDNTDDRAVFTIKRAL